MLFGGLNAWASPFAKGGELRRSFARPFTRQRQPTSEAFTPPEHYQGTLSPAPRLPRPRDRARPAAPRRQTC